VIDFTQLSISSINGSKMNLQDYLRSLNPNPSQQQILIYGSKYHLWRDGEYLGIATWTKDSNIGDSFQIESSEEVEVVIADKWELIISNPYSA